MLKKIILIFIPNIFLTTLKMNIMFLKKTFLNSDTYKENNTRLKILKKNQTSYIWTFPYAICIHHNFCLVHLICIRSVLVGVEYQNFRRTLDVYLLFAILLGQIKSKLNYKLVTYKLASQ